MKKICVILTVVILFLMLVSCMRNNKTEAVSAMASTNEVEVIDSKKQANVDMLEQSDSMVKDEGMQLQASRKLVLNAIVSLESTDFDICLSELNKALNDANGYIEASSVSNGSNGEKGHRWAEYIYRIPTNQYSEFLEIVKKTANVLSVNEIADDVTASYIDIQARLQSLQSQFSALSNLLEKAESVEDIIAIQSSITEVIYQTETITAQKRALDNQIDFSKFSINVQEVTRVNETAESFFDKLKKAFFDGFYTFGRSLQNLALSIVYFIPSLILGTTVVALCVCFAIKQRKKRLNKNYKQAEKNKPSVQSEIE